MLFKIVVALVISPLIFAVAPLTQGQTSNMQLEKMQPMVPPREAVPQERPPREAPPQERPPREAAPQERPSEEGAPLLIPNPMLHRM